MNTTNEDKKRKYVLAALLLAIVGVILLVLSGGKHKTSRDPLTEGVEQIVLYLLRFDTDWIQAGLRCHENEEQCADEHLGKLPKYMRKEGDREEYISMLKSLYQDYPAPVRLEELKNSIGPAIESAVPHTKKTIYATSEKEIARYFNDPDALIVVIRYDVDRSSTPHIGMLSESLYRPGVNISQFLGRNVSVPIPLNLPEDDMRHKVEQLKKHWLLQAIPFEY